MISQRSIHVLNEVLKARPQEPKGYYVHKEALEDQELVQFVKRLWEIHCDYCECHIGNMMERDVEREHLQILYDYAEPELGSSSQLVSDINAEICHLYLGDGISSGIYDDLLLLEDVFSLA